MDPYKAAEAAYKAHEGMGDHQVRAAVTAALVAERKRTLAYWLCRLRQRVIWFGGWEEANCGGWCFRRGKRWMSPAPVSVLRVFTHFGWGWQLRLPGTFLVRSKCSGVYISPDGTPRSATLWVTKKPEHV
jgi:hypothetical protein